MTGVAVCATDTAAVEFADVQRVLALFAQGIAGRHLHLKPFEAGAAAGRRGRIFTDGNSVHLPSAMAGLATPAHNFGAYRIVILHQIGYLDGGTFDFSLTRARLVMHVPDAAPTWGQLPHVLRLVPPRRAAELERFYACSSRPALLRRVFVTLEDLRIDTAMRRRYPGARGDLARVLAHALMLRPDRALMRPLAGLLEALLCYSLGACARDLAADDGTGLVAPVLKAAVAVEMAHADVYDSARAALAIHALLEEWLRRPRRYIEVAPAEVALDTLAGPAPPDLQAGGLPDEEVEGLAEPASDDFEGPGVEFRGELLPGLVQRNFQGGQVGSLPDNADAAETEGARGPDDMSLDPARAPGRATGARRALPDGPRSFLYDEWDYRNRTYLKAWCRLYEYRLKGDDFGFIDEVRRRHALLAAQVRRQFGMIRPEAWQRVHHTSDGDELGLDAVIEAVIDRRAGHGTDEYLYVRRDRAQRDVAAAFLLDMSASTDFPIPDPARAVVTVPDAPAQDPYLWGRFGAVPDPAPASPKRRVIDVARESLALMCDALDALGDPHAIYGFSGAGRDNVEFHVARDFGEALTARTWAALGAIEPRRSTRMGPAIRHAAARLARQGAAVKVLIMVSDGYPQDSDYGPDRRDEEYGIQDTARALQEAAHAGIDTFCVTIDPAGHDYLQRMCAPRRYMVIDDVAALPRELTKIYRALTA